MREITNMQRAQVVLPKTAPQRRITEDEFKTIMHRIREVAGVTNQPLPLFYSKIRRRFGVDKFRDLAKDDYSEVLAYLEREVIMAMAKNEEEMTKYKEGNMCAGCEHYESTILDMLCKNEKRMKDNIVFTLGDFLECIRFEIQNVTLVLPKWHNYGLSMDFNVVYEKGGIIAGLKRHNIVTQYLDNHKDIRKEYKTDQSGKYKYYDVLKLAELEEKNEKEGDKEE